MDRVFHSLLVMLCLQRATAVDTVQDAGEKGCIAHNLESTCCIIDSERALGERTLTVCETMMTVHGNLGL